MKNSNKTFSHQSNPSSQIDPARIFNIKSLLTKADET